MNLNNKIVKYALILTVVGLGINACQKMDRPELGELVLDPPPPPYNELKNFWAFENNLSDQGEGKLNGAPTGVTYVAGVTGQAAKIGTGGYILVKAIGDTITYPNGFTAVPADTLTNLGSFTLAFWMNGPGPVKDGAQGLFSISNKAEFWGNLDLFIENLDNGSELFLKVHMFNAGVPSGNGEQWNEVKIANGLNKWTHIAVTYNGLNSQFTIYADGQPTAIKDKVLGGGTYGSIKFNNFNGVVIGNHQFQTNPSLSNHGPESWARPFNGALDQLRLYDRALSAAEITDLYTTKK
jgi:hypothetical protein